MACQGSTKADGFNLDVVALTLNKPVGEGDWGAGYNATLLFGPDATGYNNSAGSSTSDFSLKDTYVDLHAPLGNGLDLKLGTFTEILGYEVYETGNNPNYTRSYGYEIEPTALDGRPRDLPVLADHLGAGWRSPTRGARASTRAVRPPKAESYKTYHGRRDFDRTGKPRLSGGVHPVSAAIINGYDAVCVPGHQDELLRRGNYQDPAQVPVGWCCLRLRRFGQQLPRLIRRPATRSIHSSGYQNATALYLLWHATEKLTFNTRADYFSQSEYLASSGNAEQGVRSHRNGPVRLMEECDQPAGIPLGPLGERAGCLRRHRRRFAPSLKNAFLVAANVIYKF